MPFSRNLSLCFLHLLFHHARCDGYMCDSSWFFPSHWKWRLQVWNCMTLEDLNVLRFEGVIRNGYVYSTREPYGNTLGYHRITIPPLSPKVTISCNITPIMTGKVPMDCIWRAQSHHRPKHNNLWPNFIEEWEVGLLTWLHNQILSSLSLATLIMIS
jgi:hypothetical protein